MVDEERDVQTLFFLLASQPFPDTPQWKAPHIRQIGLGLIARDLLGRIKRGRTQSGSGPLSTLQELIKKTDHPTSPEGKHVSPEAVADDRLHRPKVDVLIICPLVQELNASLIAFGIDPFVREHENIDGHKVYYTTFMRKDNSPLSLAISVVTKARNVPCSILTQKLIREFEPQAVFLSGIAAGVKEKVGLTARGESR